ncbi:MAG: hypothetical protein FJX42_06030 [Alphaproteobacteria bacterium]|nr:hypothetical protein [Alphaproteobacteria bacterium]
MAETLSIIAVFVAFVAVWFTAEVLKRLNHRVDPSKNPYVIALAQGLEQKDRWIIALDERVKVLEAELSATRGVAPVGMARRPLPDIEKDLSAVSRGLRKARALSEEMSGPRPEQRVETREEARLAELRERELRASARSEPRLERERSRANASAA